MGVIDSFIEIYRNFVQGLPPQSQIFANLLILTLVIVIYAVFVWKFYVFISTRDILKLNLRKYNRTSHPVLAKIVAGFLYIVEYIIILPLLIFFWFGIFTILLTLITQGFESSSIVLIAAIVIAAVRICSYIPNYGETVASEVAKIVPLTLLAFSITNPEFFNLGEIFQELTKIPQVLGEVRLYVFFIIFLELILRFFTFIVSIFRKSKDSDEQSSEK